MPSTVNLRMLTAILALTSVAAQNTYLRKKTPRTLRRAVNHIEKVEYKQGLEEDVEFWTKLVRKTQYMSLPPDPVPTPTNPPVSVGTDPPIGSVPPGTSPPVGTAPPVGTSPPVAAPTSLPFGSPTLPPVAVDPTDPPIAGPGDMPTYSPIPATPPPVSGPVTDPPVPATDPPATTPVPAPSGGGAVAVDDATTIFSTDGIAFIAVLENDTAAAGQSLSVKKAAGASNGSCSIGLDLIEVVYMPNAGFVGVDSCEYEACDDQEPPQCVSATVTITVT
ncbi:hypothetical protein ACHAW5_001054 [Stephanodiscus triporus]|uniref:Uncharacterized protein n=1 Tax=Stephanodiscus triporus TaxID=2934178 RepID=A0ABD3NW40_9STRA